MLTLNKSKNILLTLNRPKKHNSKTPMGETGYLCIFCLGHCLVSPALYSGSQTYEGLHQLWALPWHSAFFCFFECIGIQFFNLDTLVSDLGDTMPRQRSLTRTHMWLMGRHATPEVTLHIPILPPLGKRRISPGVINILSMYLRLHT